jgi:hypothetical protein
MKKLYLYGKSTFLLENINDTIIVEEFSVYQFFPLKGSHVSLVEIIAKVTV